jgi:hypothetical protein
MRPGRSLTGGRIQMFDVLMVAFAAAFFVAFLGYAALCERM